jgi:hypothetical protein
MIDAANSVQITDPEYAGYYQPRYDETRHHHHRRALVRTVRKLVWLVFAWLSQGQLDQPRRSIG